MAKNNPETLRAYREAHREERRAASRAYSTAHREERHAHYAAHREEAAAQTRAYYMEHREQIKAHVRAWAKANQEKIRAYRAEHREERHTNAKDWRKAHPEECRIHNRTYRKAHGEQRKATNLRHKALRRGAAVGPVELEAIKIRDRMRCCICGKRVAEKDLSYDHSWPVSLGGPHTQENIRVAHLRCNRKRGAGRLPVQMVLC